MTTAEAKALLEQNRAAQRKGGRQHTKIVATIGPTSEQLEPLTQVVKNGLSVMRLNFSHATKEEVELRCTNLEIAEVCTFCRIFVAWTSHFCMAFYRILRAHYLL